MLAFPAKRLMLETDKAVRIDLFRANTPQMRAFHLTWLAFFFCFFARFGISPLMPIIRKEFQKPLIVMSCDAISQPPMLTMSCAGQTPMGIVLLGTSPRIIARTMSIRPAR